MNERHEQDAERRIADARQGRGSVAAARGIIRIRDDSRQRCLSRRLIVCHARVGELHRGGCGHGR